MPRMTHKDVTRIIDEACARASARLDAERQRQEGQPMSKARKGDIVALVTNHVTHFINPPRHESHVEWTLVKVASATRMGKVTAVIWRGSRQELTHLCAYKPTVWTLVSEQERAKRLMASDPDRWFSEPDALKEAIRAA